MRLIHSVSTVLVMAILIGCGTTPPSTSSLEDAQGAADTGTQLDVAVDAAVVDRPVATDMPTVIDTASPADTPVPEEDVAGCPPLTTRCGATCVNLSSDPRHCGTCATDCTTLPGVDAARILCTASACSPLSGCLAGRTHCSTNPFDGCEVDLATPAHCGACATVCAEPTPLCTRAEGTDAGASTYRCASGCSGTTPTRCDGMCVDLQNNPNHCGACRRACPAPSGGTATCVTGACVPTCPSGRHLCGDACVSNTEVASCGALCTPCPTPANSVATCNGTTCGSVCAAGFADCDGLPGNGCEVDLRVTSMNCGTCGHACTLPNATAGCSAGACVVASCAVGFANCNGNAADGCETDIRISGANCGSCGRVCTATHATPVCSAGSCAFSSCQGGFGNCDGMAGNDCEATLNTTANCGSCGTVCPTPGGSHTVPACLLEAGTHGCGAACESGWTDCDANLANGCEVMGACFLDQTLFSDDFETGAPRWSLDPPWRALTMNSFFACVGTGVLYALPLSCPLSGDATLQTDINASRATTLSLNYRDSAANVGAGNRFRFAVSTDRGATWNTTDITRTGSCGMQTIDLSAYAGQPTVRVRLSFSRGCNDFGEWRVDEVRVHGLIRQF